MKKVEDDGQPLGCSSACVIWAAMIVCSCGVLYAAFVLWRILL